MDHTEQRIACFSCRGRVPEVAGPTHAYMLSSPGCWQLYGEILSRDYMAEQYDPHVHRITVDTYAVQHPGCPERRTIQSVNGHLMSLFVLFEMGWRAKEATTLLKKAVEDESLQRCFQWLEPPLFDGTVTVADVAQAKDSREHEEWVRRWGESVWQVWRDRHRDAIAGLADRAIHSRG